MTTLATAPTSATLRDPRTHALAEYETARADYEQAVLDAADACQQLWDAGWAAPHRLAHHAARAGDTYAAARDRLIGAEVACANAGVGITKPKHRAGLEVLS